MFKCCRQGCFSPSWFRFSLSRLRSLAGSLWTGGPGDARHSSGPGPGVCTVDRLLSDSEGHRRLETQAGATRSPEGGRCLPCHPEVRTHPASPHNRARSTSWAAWCHLATSARVLTWETGLSLGPQQLWGRPRVHACGPRFPQDRRLGCRDTRVGQETESQRGGAGRWALSTSRVRGSPAQSVRGRQAAG